MSGVFCTLCKWEAPHKIDVTPMTGSFSRFYSEVRGMRMILKRNPNPKMRSLWLCRDCKRYYCTLCWERMSVTHSQWLCRDCEVRAVIVCSQWDECIHLWGNQAKQALLALLTLDACYKRIGKSHLGRRALTDLFYRHLVQNHTQERSPRNKE